MILHRKLYHCKENRHTLCPMWQRCYGDRPEKDLLLTCSCDCGHVVIRRLVSAGVLIPPSWATPDEVALIESLRTEDGP